MIIKTKHKNCFDNYNSMAAYVPIQEHHVPVHLPLLKRSAKYNVRRVRCVRIIFVGPMVTICFYSEKWIWAPKISMHNYMLACTHFYNAGSDFYTQQYALKVVTYETFSKHYNLSMKHFRQTKWMNSHKSESNCIYSKRCFFFH